ncbi:MAG: hypothetical protein ABJC63_00220 [Gemmatimonadales bacterium]
MKLPEVMRSVLISACLCVAFNVPAVNELAAQAPRVTGADFSTGSDYENYLRILQVSGLIKLSTWSIRAFSQREIAAMAKADTVGPWRLKMNYTTGMFVPGSASLTTIYNTKYPYGANDGPIWAGRAFTFAASGAVSGSRGPISYKLAPIAFWARNRWWQILDNGKKGTQAFNHGTFSDFVDLPQRFGDRPYSRIDPGQSSLRLDTKPVTLGVSTANEWIGPATEYPFLLGNNAAGFPHMFIGTGDPANIGVGHLHARVIWGKLFQSGYSPVTGGRRYTGDQTGTVRLMTSVDFVFIPRFIPGLEVGAGRFFHVPYLRREPSKNFWLKPFKEFFLKNEFASGDSAGLDNQLASAFFRWTFPKSGFEVYGERGYEDQIYDRRELLEDLDHERSYMLGFQKTIKNKDRSIDVIKGELINYQLPTLARLRVENAIYLHSPLRQGHTNEGQLLGASPGVGAAAASSFSWARYSSSGRTTVTVRRIVRDQIGNYLGLIQTYPVTLPVPDSAVVNPHGSDVIAAIGVERMRFGKRADFGGRIEAMENYNHNFAGNLGNVNLQITARLHDW